MNAIELLTSDHRKIDGIFMQFQQGGSSEQFRQLFAQLYQELSLHSLAEESVVYPVLAKFEETMGDIKEVYVEHAEAKATLAELAAMDNTSSTWSQKMTRLMKDIQNHVQLEENQIFVKLRQRMTEQQLDTLGQEIQKAKQLNLPGVQSSMPMQEVMMAGSNMPMQPMNDAQTFSI